MQTTLLLLSICSAGLVAGLLYGWMVSVLPGLARTDDQTFVSSMQAINRAIINPAFVIIFLVAPVIFAASAVVSWRAGEVRRAVWLGAGACIYLVGVLGVTFASNVPLNNKLDGFDLATANAEALANQRAAFEAPWTRWHAVRTAMSAAAMVSVAVAVVSGDQ